MKEKEILMKPLLFISTLIGAWSIGIGFRFLMMRTEDIYRINNWDKFFDWGILFLLGVLLLLLTIILYIKNKRSE